MSPVLMLGAASTGFFGLVATSMAVLSVVMARRSTPEGVGSTEGAVAAVVTIAVIAAVLCAISFFCCLAYLELARDFAQTGGD